MSSLMDELKAKGSAQVIVFLKEPLAASVSMKKAASKSSGEFITTQGITNHFLAPAKATAIAQSMGAALPLAGVRYYPNLGIVLGTVNREGLVGLRTDKGRVKDVVAAPYFRPIRPVRVAASKPPADDVTWGIRALKVPELWEAGFRGDGVLIAHLDTGVDATHPALKSAIAHFTEFDRLGREVSPTPLAHDTDTLTPGHGTHTAATIAGRAVRGKAIGVAPGATLASAIVIEGGDVIARILGGMDWAVGKKVRVLSMSLGLTGWDDSFQKLTQLLRSRGILPVFAIGNEGPGTSRSPGNYPEALSVGASDSDDQVAEFSSSESFAGAKNPRNVPALVGPGVDIISAKYPDGGYQSMDGTSMATPHIAGLAALLIQACPTATVGQIEEAIYTSCRSLPDVPSVRQGFGLPDGPKALQTLKRAVGDRSADPAPSPGASSSVRASRKQSTSKKKTARHPVRRKKS
jgi:subtilisin